MIERGASGLVALALSAMACGPGDGKGAATCMSFTVSLLGDLDGQDVDVAVPMQSSSSQLSTPPHTYEASYQGGMLRLLFDDDVIGSARPAAATGTIGMPPGTVHAGETFCVDDGTITLTRMPGPAPIDEYFVFTLARLSRGSNCPGTWIPGRLAGCAQ